MMPPITRRNEREGDQGGRPMFNMQASKLNRIAALGAEIMIAFSGSALASPLPIFPFILTAPVQSGPPQQAAPSEDEGSVAEMPTPWKRQTTSYATREAPGTIIIDTPNTYLYYVLGGGQAIRYGIGVGRDGFTWSGVQSVTKKAEWPDWTPPPEMIARQPYLPRYMAGGPGNPLGARAMYLGGTIYRIHGTNAPQSIGTHVSSGCIRLTNEVVSDLYSRVKLGIAVIVVSFGVSLTAMNWLAPRGATPTPELAQLPPLPAASRNSIILVPVAIALAAIRDAADRGSPRTFAGKADNPVSELLQNADIGWTASRGPISATGGQDVLSLATPLTGKLNVTGSLSSKATGAVSDALGGLLGGNVAKQI